MGITFACNDEYIDCSYSSFKFFRDKLASKIGSSFYELYTEPERLGKYSLPDNEYKKEYFREHAQRSIALCKKLKVPKKFQYFLWACDCGGNRQYPYLAQYWKGSKVEWCCWMNNMQRELVEPDAWCEIPTFEE